MRMTRDFMFKLLHRHIFTSVFFTCAAAVGLFAFVLMLGKVINDLLGYVISGQIPLETFATLVLLLAPYVTVYALPMGVLTGVLLVLGRMSAEHEVTAIRAAGRGLSWVAAPILVLAALGAGFGVAANFEFMPRARSAYDRMKADVLSANPLSFIVPKTFIRDFPGFVLYVSEKKGPLMKDFWLWELDERQRVKNFIRAESSRLNYDEETGSLVLTLLQGRAESRDPEQPEDFSQVPYNATLGRTSVILPLDRVLGKRTYRRKLSTLTYQELRSELRRLSTPAAGPEAEDKRRLELAGVRFAIQEKITTAFAVFSFALMAVPLGIQVARKETSANLGLAVVLALSYYFLTAVVGWFDRFPALRPDLWLWLPNVVFLGVGLWLFQRVERR